MKYLSKHPFKIPLTAALLLFCTCKNSKQYQEPGNNPSKPEMACTAAIRIEHKGIMDTITVVIHGKIYTSAANYPLAGATLTLANKQLQLSETSDSQGLFRFYHIPPGTYQLTVLYPQLKLPPTDSIHANSGEIIDLGIGLNCAEPK